MTNNETAPEATPRVKKAKAAELASTSAPAAAPTTVAPAPVTYQKRGVGRGILIGAIAASLVGGLAIGGAGGFAIATVAGHGQHMTFAGPDGQGPGGQQGQGEMPGRPPQGPQFGGGQGGMPGQQGPQNGPPQGGQSQGGQSQDGQTQGDGGSSSDGSN